MNTIIKMITLSTITSCTLFAGGYKIPEQSLNSMALSAAYVAHTDGADTNYFNPANMSFMEKDLHYIEGGITLAHLPSIDYLFGKTLLRILRAGKYSDSFYALCLTSL